MDEFSFSAKMRVLTLNSYVIACKIFVFIICVFVFVSINKFLSGLFLLLGSCVFLPATGFPCLLVVFHGVGRCLFWVEGIMSIYV